MAVPKMVAVEQSQIGENYEKYCRWFGRNDRVEWCAIFQMWSADQAGYNLVDWTTVTSDPNDFPYSEAAFAGRILRFFNYNNRLQYGRMWGGNYTPKSGDIIGFTWSNNPDLAMIDHVGIVESCENGVITTIEGNSGKPPYDRVKRNIWHETDSEVLCFGMMEGSVITISDLVISAICGNFWRESTVNAGIWESLIPMPWDYIYNYSDPNKGGYGIGGFTNTQSQYGTDMRLLRMHDWCVNNGYAVDDGSAQLYYIVFVERLWAGVYQNDDFDEYLSSDETDLYTLVDQWCRYWEGVPGNAMPQRYAYAQQAYDYIQAHKTDDPADYHWIAGNRFLSTDETLNNVMCLYFWFKNYYTPTDGGGGGSGGSGKGAGRIPVWMMLRSPALYKKGAI